MSQTEVKNVIEVLQAAGVKVLLTAEGHRILGLGNN